MYKVIKEYAGVLVGSEIEVHPKYVNHMIEQGYIEEIKAPENKAIVPEYKQRGRKRNAN